MANFPQKIWDGRSKSRLDLDNVKGPDHADWMAMLDELQATQSYILNLTDSTEAMPNVAKEIHEAKDKVKGLVKNLEQLSPPANLQKDVDELRAAIEEADVKGEHDRLKRGVKKLFLRTQSLIDAYKKLKTETEHTLEVLSNSMRVNLTKLRRDMEARCDHLAEQVKELQDVLESPELD
ncbi:MAG: hypothetical protein AMS22_05120 [Thiotrichales bacterium SG8_50]|nr:MAG: hypothetical protein AMS22_05120 [Thiotrichales bacterium SG8_50]